MPASALRFKRFGWYAPKLNASGANASGTVITVPFTGDPLTAGALTPSQFTCLVAGASRAVTGATAAATSLTVQLVSGPTTGQSVSLSYAGGGAAPLKDAQGDLVPAFTIPVPNWN